MPSSPPTPPPDAGEAAATGRFSRLLRFWPYAAISGLWLVVALIFAGQQSLSSKDPALSILRHALLEWLPWILLSPVLFAIATRFPPVRRRLLLACSINLVATLLCLAGAELLYVTFTKPAAAAPAAAPSAAPFAADRRPPPPRFPEDDFGPPEGPGYRPGPYFNENRPPLRAEGANLPPAGGGSFRHLVNVHLPVALFVLMAAQAQAAFAGLRERERRSAALAASLTQAKLSALQSQLQPHFLFNALNALATIVHRDANQADEMINNLAELLRRSLAAGKRPETTLGEELDHLACYLAIERVRFGDRLQIDWRIDAAARPAFVPVLALQPILENAIKHGVERRRETVGRIAIAASAEAGRLRVTITDNGPGPDLDSSAAPAPVRPGHGIGLANTRARLHALHGNDAAVALDPAAGGGCRVTVTLPLRLQPTVDPLSPPA